MLLPPLRVIARSWSGLQLAALDEIVRAELDALVGGKGVLVQALEHGYLVDAVTVARATTGSGSHLRSRLTSIS